MKQRKINEKFYPWLRTTGLQLTRLYGLVKVHKKVTPLRPVLLMSGSSYENINKFPCYQVQILRLTRKMPELL